MVYAGLGFHSFDAADLLNWGGNFRPYTISGQWWHLAAYLFTGVVAGMASMMWYSAVSVGASGAIFGLFGVFISLLISPIIKWNTATITIGVIVVFVVYNYLYGFASGIDNVAHIIGLISGVFIGWLFYPAVRRGRNAYKY
jgi:rhomboid protease GluP